MKVFGIILACLVAFAFFRPVEAGEKANQFMRAFGAAPECQGGQQ